MGEKEKSKTGILIAAGIWLVIVVVLAVVGKLFILPYFQDELVDETGSDSLYKHEVKIAADSFSGYAVLRSQAMHKDLKAQGIKLEIQDDQADYLARMEALKDRDIQMAVFTIDSFIRSGYELGKFPATIVMVIDETSGADAIVSYKGAVENLHDLDDESARIVLTPNSPSEFLARTVIAHFNLPSLPEDWMEEADGAGEVYKKMKAADPELKRAYVLWEPWVSKALERDDLHVLLSSAKLKGYIVDVLVAEREFLRDRPELVQAVVEAYFRSAYSYEQKTGGMTGLVMDDAAQAGGDKLLESQAKSLVEGIQWKNTLENYAYFGLASNVSGAQHIEEVIANITDVLVKTGAMEKDPLDGAANTIYYDKTLAQLQADGFHPGKKVNVIDGLGLGSDDLEAGRQREKLRPLSDQEWEKLMPVGELRIKPISFGRGGASINIQSERDLAALAKTLEAWPDYYLLIVGHSRAEGDPEANMMLSKQRAEAAAEYLLRSGVENIRIKVKAAKPSDLGGEAQSVTFELMQMPY